MQHFIALNILLRLGFFKTSKPINLQSFGYFVLLGASKNTHESFNSGKIQVGPFMEPHPVKIP